MSVQGWDLLFQYFRDIVPWYGLGYFAFQFEDFLAVNTLIACQRYGHPDDHGDYRCWYSPEKDTGQECRLAVLNGFIAVTKGFSNAPIQPIKVEGDIVKERVSRCYLVGRISKNDTLALRLAEELKERVARFQVLLYDPELEIGNRKPIPPYTADELADTWITRFRTAPTKDFEQLSSQPWTVECSLDDILSDVASINFFGYGSMAKNYYEFIIIDRTPGRTFNLLDIVADALQKLNKDPPYSEIFRQATQKYLPVDERDDFLRALVEVNPDSVPRLPFPNQYVSNRVRCWNAVKSFQTILKSAKQDRPLILSPFESRFISNVVTDLESHGVITRISEYERPYTLPIIMSGTDGYDDIYFNYKFTSSVERNISNLNPPRRNLLEFSKAYKRDHPNAVFAKGRINVHYCAWPLPMPAHFQSLHFETPEGRIYRWEVLPFDLPLASCYWQSIVNREINDKLPFACLVDTTLVVCAENRETLGTNLKALSDIGKKFKWSFSIPDPSSASWATDFRQLGLGALWEGVRPALAQAIDGDAIK
ncbi:hypothetical protein AOL_s00210g164 [Orbilia oligospora ATCC 24927]|uniref:Uncharacterized protein n=1 Tax=Arthrobotrys oligospora (strain ATCC 24927 / CBS 115.81 / DSM 1491) TaxID=756982 RepID=G1XS06_ARTOA|nr:hypothetical protein AOL_s00210g164 [Orbilia oligospora ATCC 24927]EGX44003.1 hypothetical protein AOL_s00210g164 [Orbilia oligospora ATCC 24927]